MKRTYPLLSRGRMTRNRLLAAMGEGYWCWPVRHLKKAGKRLFWSRDRMNSKKDLKNGKD